MSRHLVRLFLFLALQGAIYGILTNGENPPPPVQTAAYEPAPTLRHFITERVQPMLASDPRIVEAALTAGSRHGLIADLITEYRNGPDRYVAAARDKSRRLHQLDGRKIILVGGSNLAFSCDSQILLDRYGIAPVNMGLHAGLGPRFMIRQVADHVNRGDVVILAMEPGMLINGPGARPGIAEDLCRVCPEFEPLFSPPAESVSFWQAMTDAWTSGKHFADRQALATLAKQSRSGFSRLCAVPVEPGERLPGIPAQNGKNTTKPDRQFVRMLNISQQRYLQMSGIYQRATFNRFGDATRHRPLEFKAQHLVGKFDVRLHSGNEPALRESICVLNDFAETCRSAGATIFFSYTPIPDTPSVREFASRYEHVMNEELDIPILFPIERSYTRSDELFDTTAHLNWKGTLRRMAVLSEALDHHLEPVSRVSVADQIAMRARDPHDLIVANSNAVGARVQ